MEVAPKEPKIVETALERMTTKTENERCANDGGTEVMAVAASGG